MKIDKERYEKYQEYKAKVDAWRESVREGHKRKPVQERTILCIGCAPGHACTFTLPCTTADGFVALYCPCTGEEVTGVVK